MIYTYSDTRYVQRKANRKDLGKLLGPKIAHFRMPLMTQEQLAVKATQLLTGEKITRDSIAQYETGEQVPPLRKLFAIEKALELEKGQLTSVYEGAIGNIDQPADEEFRKGAGRDLALNRKIRVLVYRGGSTGVWSPNSMERDEVYVYAFMSLCDFFVKLDHKDTNLSDHFEQGTVMCFAPTDTPQKRRWLLVQNIADPDKYSIRTYLETPKGHAYGIPGQAEVLPVSEWQTIGYAWATARGLGDSFTNINISENGIEV